jgi:hypothetical protein
VAVSGAVLNSARWRWSVPIAFVTYSFFYVDRSNYSIGAAGGLTDALGRSGSEIRMWALIGRGQPPMPRHSHGRQRSVAASSGRR